MISDEIRRVILHTTMRAAKWSGAADAMEISALFIEDPLERERRESMAAGLRRLAAELTESAARTRKMFE